MRMMVGIRQRLFISIFFVLVLVPAVILSLLAVRAVNQEEMVQRRRLEDALLLELDQTNTIILFTLEQILQELRDTIPKTAAENPRGNLVLWKESTPLAGTPYLLDADGTILYPDIADRSMSGTDQDAANLFYWRYLNLFSNKEPIPIYRNIVKEFTEDILSAEDSAGPADVQDVQGTRDTAKKAAEAPAAAGSLAPAESPLSDESPAPADSLASTERAESAERAVPAESPAPVERPLSTESPAARSRSAMGMFETDSVVQERVYQKAEEEGLQSLQRNVLPRFEAVTGRENPRTVVRSVYVESTRYFNEIITGGEYGLIPRLFDSAFILLYWERQGETIAGCELDMGAVRERFLDAVRTPENSLRYINILDQAGDPIIPSGDLSAEEWRQPFVAKEISELLPYWETAILLRSNEEFQRQIETSRYYLSFLIFFLCLLIFAGMAAIYQFSSSRLREVQQRVGFVTTVSHELKTPLTSIRLYSEMLSEGYQKDPEKIRKYSSYIASESQRLSRLIGNVLVFAKLEKGTMILNPETVDLNDLIREFHETVREELAGEGFSVSVRLSEEPLFIQGDREAVIQVLLNLLSNARKYCADEKRIEMRTGKTGQWVCVDIIDWGIGIPKKYEKRIFREFFRIDSGITAETKGTGLGLAIARRIMRRHNGDLVYAPRESGNHEAGSVFTMRFPPPPFSQSSTQLKDHGDDTNIDS